MANCAFSAGVAEGLDASDGSYDVVVTSQTIHHLPENLRPQAIAEMFRVLRPAAPCSSPTLDRRPHESAAA